MEENLLNFLMGYCLEAPFFQRFNINSFQRLGLRFSQIMNLSSFFQPLGLGLDLSVNATLNAPKLRVRPQIDKRLWTNAKI
jgi:hypothetical protein